MLQDLSFGTLDNQYKALTPEAGDVAVLFRDGQTLLHRAADDSLRPPVFSHADQGRYLFTLQDKRWFLYTGDPGDWEQAFSWEPVRQLRQLQSKEICFGIMTAWHLYNW